MKVIFAASAIILASLAQAAHGYNSILTKDGYVADTKLVVRQGNDKSFNTANSEHFIIMTTLANPAAQDMVRHLEVWHSQIMKVLPRSAEIFAEKRGQKVTMHVFATREDKAKFYGTTVDKVGVDTFGIICEKANDKLNIPVTSLQHECYHFWNDIFMGKDEPSLWEEGGADFLGMWDIDKSQEYNLGGENYKEGWALVEKLKSGKGTWITYEQIVKNVTPKGGEIYAQGWLLHHFMLNSPVGQKHAQILFTAYETDSKAPKIQNTQRNFYRTEGNKVVFNQQYIQLVERDWKDYIKTLKKPDNQAQQATENKNAN